MDRARFLTIIASNEAFMSRFDASIDDCCNCLVQTKLIQAIVDAIDTGVGEQVARDSLISWTKVYSTKRTIAFLGSTTSQSSDTN